MNDSARRLKEVVLALQPEARVAVLTQDNPDPDAMGSAYGMAYLCESLRSDLGQVDIFYGGAISHPQNRTMLNVLGLNLRKMRSFDPDKYALVMLVDVASTGKKNLQSTSITPQVVIDHHRDDPEGEYLLKDIRPVGATASMVTQYIRELGVDLEHANNGADLVATALLVGIKTDTHEMTAASVSALDFECYEYLLRIADRKKLHQIIYYTVPRYLYDLKAQAYRDMDIRHSVCVTGIGVVPPAQRDSLPVIADELLRMEGVETVVVYSIVEDRIVASLRTDNDSLEINSFCQDVFGEEYSGGKIGSGGASVPLGFMTPTGDTDDAREHVWEAVKAVVSHRVFKAASSG